MSYRTVRKLDSWNYLGQHVEEGLAEADQVHGDGHGLGQHEHQPDGAAELGTWFRESRFV